MIKKKLAASSKEMQNSRKGWRGLSVDLITALDDAVNSELDREIEAPDTGPGKLDGRIVLRIWSKSKLPREKLREIWYVASTIRFSMSHEHVPQERMCIAKSKLPRSGRFRERHVAH